MHVKKFLPLAALLPVLVMGACGGDDDDDETPAVVPGTSTPVTTTSPTAQATAVETAGSTPGGFSGSTNPVEAAPPAGVSQPRLVAMRAAAQPGFDRLVFEFDGALVPGYKVAYGEAAVACGSGSDLTDFIGGGKSPAALLLVDMRPAVGHDDAGQPTAPRDLQPSLSTLKRVVRTCDFEGVVGYGVGLSARKPFAVSTLNNPPRLVIDIAQ